MVSGIRVSIKKYWIWKGFSGTYSWNNPLLLYRQKNLIITKENKMKRIITLITCFTIGIAAEGKIGGVTYFDYATSKGKSAFNLGRQYFSYSGEASDNIKFKIVFDVGRTNVFNNFVKSFSVISQNIFSIFFI